MMANGASKSATNEHLLGLAARLYAADAAVTQALDTRPPGWRHWMWRRAAARAAARLRPDVTDLAATAWTLLAELSAAESGHTTAQNAARRMATSHTPSARTAATRPVMAGTTNGAVQ
jgi:hypothetical protein